MIDGITTLLAIQKFGTLTAAAVHLRLTQSALSKRVAAMEVQCGKKMLEKHGRNVRLTSAAESLIIRSKPLLDQLNEILYSEVENRKTVQLAVSDSLLSSQGARLLKGTHRLKEIQLHVHGHRGPLVIDRVASGDYQLGLVAGSISQKKDCIVEPFSSEEMVIVKNGEEASKSHLPNGGRKRQHGPKSLRQKRKVLFVEPKSLTWAALQPEFESRQIHVIETVESFFAVAQMALAGLGDGLVPLGVAKALALPSHQVQRFSKKWTRPIFWVVKKSFYNSYEYQEIKKQIKPFKTA